MKDLTKLKYPRFKVVTIGQDGGAFKWRHRGKNYNIIASFGGGWDHVSVDANGLIPDWNTMCLIKDMFFNENETVIEYHPAKENYVNIAKDCLHLWRPQNQTIPTPPIEFV